MLTVTIATINLINRSYDPKTLTLDATLLGLVPFLYKICRVLSHVTDKSVACAISGNMSTAY